MDGGISEIKGQIRIITSYLVYILEWETQRLVGGTGWWLDVVEGSQQGLASSLHLFAGDLAGGVPSLEPFHVGGLLQHVVSMPARDWHEGDSIRVESNLLDVAGHLLSDFLETGLQQDKYTCETLARDSSNN